ncbi:MAG: hypothetical protein AUJ52_00910 [Elusimicrobia bacterium CG1_02_63_36]|nr:MAG: hypothetical protein AUJ52_00910 [Elusimicrobia bacterium CG1_02_63_36]PIP84400.1 MAG: hypothetical protein COR54_04340 [Elusimicrobia bacterium CG22_combo_CG10-13_8_21_14_all_63_91]PJA18653.1 MAG: hypothetical protein COX66_00610 [Elusimicrobia bacterium CG_4_10_14_0_2_um_filter_63_34]PJB23397.1 MAG: hypothetical protein CO113_18325 [Elusimicrobia bacterium CG_4_9_14_3_um_filter_62_55]
MNETTPSETASAAHHEDHEALYLKVFGMLCVLTALTVGVSYFHFPKPFGLLIGLAIAVGKAALVVSFFMHLKWEKALIYYVLGLTAFFAVFLFVLPIADFALITDRNVHDAHPAILDTGKTAHSEEKGGASH